MIPYRQIGVESEGIGHRLGQCERCRVLPPTSRGTAIGGGRETLSPESAGLCCIRQKALPFFRFMMK